MTPSALELNHGARIVLLRWLGCAEPDEGCALLLGDCGSAQNSGLIWRVKQIWPCLNVWPVLPERGRRFLVDPREQLVAQKWGRQRGMVVLGAAHSHPQGDAVPSATDCALTLAPALMVILGSSGDLVAWWLAEQHTQPQRLPWRMDH